MAFLSATAPTQDFRLTRWAADNWRSLLMLGAGVASLVAPPSRTLQIAMLLAGMAVLGVPHGVFDNPLLWKASRGRMSALVGLGGLYLSLGGAVLAGWALAPLATLMLFLVLAGAHFGLERAPGPAATPFDRLVHPAARGASVLAPLIFLHPAEVTPWLSALADRPAGQVQAAVATLAPAALGMWAVLVGMSTARRLQAAETSAALELLALAGLFLLAPPLLGFAVYLTAIHAQDHVLKVGRARSTGNARLDPQTWCWLAVWLAPAALACTLGVAVSSRLGGLEAAAVQALRILAALAAPHLLLGPWLERRAAAAPAVGRVPPRGRALSPWRGHPGAGV